MPFLLNNLSNKRFGFLFFALLLLAGCKGVKKTTDGEIVNLKKRSARYLLKKMEGNRLEAEWLSAKARIIYQDEEQTRKFNSYVRMKRDSVIWMNIKKASVEAFRVLITPDSIYAINRLDKQYFIESLDFLQEKYNLPANFTALQDALLGNPYLPEGVEMESDIDQKKYHLFPKPDQLLRQTVAYWLNGQDYQISRMLMKDDERNRNLSVQLSDYQVVGGNRKFATERNFTVNSEESGTVSVEISLSKVELDVPKRIIFSISDRYERVSP